MLKCESVEVQLCEIAFGIKTWKHGSREMPKYESGEVWKRESVETRKRGNVDAGKCGSVEAWKRESVEARKRGSVDANAEARKRD